MSTIARVRGHFRRCVQTLARLERDIIRELEVDRVGSVPDSLSDLPESGQVENQSEGEEEEDGIRETAGQSFIFEGSYSEGNEETTAVFPSLSESAVAPGKKYFQLSSMSRGNVKQVSIESVEAPDYIIVNLAVGSHEARAHQDQELQTTHRESKPKPLVSVKIDQPCLVENKNTFYRGKVINIESELIQVRLVDTGSIEVRNRDSLYQIEERFLNMTEACLMVRLAGVTPRSAQSCWPTSSSTTLRERIEGKELVMFIQEAETQSKPFSVILYEDLPDRMVCINFWLTTVHQAALTPDACMSLQYSKPSSSQSAGQDGRTKNSLAKNSFETFSARVISLQSPSSIAVRSLRNEPDLEKTTRDLEHYFRSGSRDTFRAGSGPARGDYVAVSLEQGWARGKVMEVTGESAKVHLVDYGADERVTVDSLRRLPRNFLLGWDFTEQVHLSAITPTSLHGNWSQEAIEFLRNILLTHDMKVELQCLGKSINRSTPVKMLLIDYNEPNLIDVEERLVTAGLALGHHTDNPHSPEIEEVDDVEDLKDRNDQKKWVEGERLSPGNFVTVATHVDWEGLVYLVRNGGTLDMISKLLQMKYECSVPRPVDRFWSVGDAAVVYSDKFSGWHRAVVLQVNTEHLVTVYVQRCFSRFMRIKRSAGSCLWTTGRRTVFPMSV